MKFRIDKKYIRWGITAFLVIAASISFYYLLFHGSNISSGFHSLANLAMPILDGLILAYLLTPILNAVEKKGLLPLCQKINIKTEEKKIRKKIRMLSILLTMIIVSVAVYSFFAMVIPQLIRSIQSIIFQFPVYIDNLTGWITKLLADYPEVAAAFFDVLENYSDQLNHYVNDSFLPKMNELIRSVSMSFLGFVMQLWNLIIGFIISIYILSSKELFAGQAKKMIYAFFETDMANAVIADVRFTHRTFSGFMVGKVIDSIIIGIICFAGTNLMGTPYAVLISVIVGITNVIPFFGPYLGAIPSALLVLMVDPIQCLYFIIFILILQQFDGNILGPKILGNSTGLSSFWVIFSITLFGGLFGVLGMIIGVPAFAVFYAAVKSIVNHLLRRKQLPTDTVKYLNVGSIENQEFIPYEQDENTLNEDSDEAKDKSIINNIFRREKQKQLEELEDRNDGADEEE